MRMLSGRMHWLTVGLALLVSAQGFATKRLHGQAPPAGMAGQMPYGMPPGMGGAQPGGGMMSPDRPTSMVFEGPPPMEVAYGDTSGGYGGLRGRLAGNGNGCLGSGALLSLLGPLAPYNEGGQGSQRWFDFYAGTMGLSRTSDFGGFQTSERNPQDGTYPPTYKVSTNGISGPTVLSTSDLSLDKMRYGLELIGAIQLGPGSSVEARYFGLNNWNVSKQVEIIPPALPTLYSVYSQFGNSPMGGFVDVDEASINKISYNSELHNGEVNYRRRFVSPFASGQGSWLAGVRYFDLDERFGFNAIGPSGNPFDFNQVTQTRNELTGFQIGGDYWVNVAPGLMIGAESKGGIYGNHATSETQITAQSIPGAHERISDGRTAYLGELVVSAVYRLSYSWSVKTSYNLLYVDNVALAPENYNTRDLSNALGSGAFTSARHPFIDTDGEVCYQGWSIGGEYLW